MTPLQQLIVKNSEMRTRLSELGSNENLTDEQRAELESLRTEYQDNEQRQRALIVAGDEPAQPMETRDDSQGRELRRLLNRGSVGTMLQNMLTLRSEHEGPEQEIAKHYGLGTNQLPVTMLHNWERFTPLEKRAAVAVPTDVAAAQHETLDYVFPMACAAFLGVDMPTVPVGDSVYPVFSTSPVVASPAEGVSVAETDGIILSEVLTPGRLQASYRFSREDKYKFNMLESDLRDSLSMGISDGLDLQIVAGVNGLLGTSGLTARAGDAGAEAVFSDYRQLLYDADTIDGRYSGMASDIRMVMGPATYNHAGAVYRTANSDISALENLMMASGGVKASAHVPAPNAGHDQDVIIAKGMRRAMVAPLWMGLDIIFDEVTRAADGYIVLTAVALYSVKIIRADDYQRRTVQVAS